MRLKTCPKCKGIGKVYTVSDCEPCKGTGKLSLVPYMTCEVCGSEFECPLTKKHRCKHSSHKPYHFKDEDGISQRICVCDDCSGDEWAKCGTILKETGD